MLDSQICDIGCPRLSDTLSLPSVNTPGFVNCSSFAGRHLLLKEYESPVGFFLDAFGFGVLVCPASPV